MATLTSKSVIDSYRRYAPTYDWVFGAVLEPGRIQLAESVMKLSPRSILEIGVGTGLMLPRYPKHARIVGVDISLEMLAVAQKRANKLAEHQIALIASDAETLDFPDNSFECVTLPYVLSVTPHPQKLISEIRRVCQPGGKILILNHFSDSRYWWLLERLVSPIADKIGFNSNFGYDEHVLGYDWLVESVRPINLFGLSKLVAIRNDKKAS